jgi:hypothetical protein
MDGRLTRGKRWTASPGARAHPRPLPPCAWQAKRDAPVERRDSEGFPPPPLPPPVLTGHVSSLLPY